MRFDNVKATAVSVTGNFCFFMGKRIRTKNPNNHLLPCFKCKKNLRYGTQSYCYECFYEKNIVFQRKRQEKNRLLRSANKIKSLNGERWMMIEGFDNYMISDMGRVKSLYWEHASGVRQDEERLIGHKNKKSYSKIRLYKQDDKYDFFVHRLVALYFVDNPDGKSDVHHIDSNPQNNRWDNLQWVSKPEHALITKRENSNFGSGHLGEAHGSAKLTEKEVLQIRKLFATGEYKKRFLARLYSVSAVNIQRIVEKKIWNHI